MPLLAPRSQGGGHRPCPRVWHAGRLDPALQLLSHTGPPGHSARLRRDILLAHPVRCHAEAIPPDPCLHPPTIIGLCCRWERRAIQAPGVAMCGHLLLFLLARPPLVPSIG